jgi:predicted GNAT family acetyltransferase
MSFGGSPVIASVPPAYVEHTRRLAETWTPETIRDRAAMAITLGKSSGVVLGPAFIGYCDHAVQPAPAGEVRLLSETRLPDADAIASLRAACSPAEWEQGGGSTEHGAAVGVFAGGVLAALASYEIWGDRLAHIAIVADPQYRGRSYARTAVAALTAHVLEHGLIAQYRTLESNTPSMRIASSLGIVPYAVSIAVRART